MFKLLITQITQFFNSKTNNEEAKSKLGPIQQAWVKSLREHPERQMYKHLGKGDKNNYQACCLGEAILVVCRLKGIEPNFIIGRLYDSNGDEKFPTITYTELGLNSSTGELNEPLEIENKYKPTYFSLAEMNDFGFTWTEIADYIEANPDNVFTIAV